MSVATPLRTEADLVRALGTGTYTWPDLYDLARRAGMPDRPGADRDAGDGSPVWKRRLRTAVYARCRAGVVRRHPDQPVFIVDGPVTAPRRLLLLWLPRDPGLVELVLGEAAEFLARADESFDLIVADPPYGLGRGQADTGYRRTYARDHSRVVPGYVDVDPGRYAQFTAEWVAAAAEALRPGGYLAAVTGAQQSARVQVAAEDAGLTYVASIVVPRTFPLFTTRRPAHAHWRITLATRGPVDSPRRFYTPPPGTPVGAGGHPYPRDVWPPVREDMRPGLLRYDNSLPAGLVGPLIESTTRRGDLVGDPFLGGGRTLIECVRRGRRFRGCDTNPGALRFAAARLLAEEIPAWDVAAVSPLPDPGGQESLFTHHAQITDWASLFGA